MAKKQLTCRVLVTTVIGGTSFEPNSLVKGNEDLLKPLVESKELSDNEADIAYCQDKLEVKVTDLNQASQTDSDQAEE